MKVGYSFTSSTNSGVEGCNTAAGLQHPVVFYMLYIVGGLYVIGNNLMFSRSHRNPCEFFFFKHSREFLNLICFSIISLPESFVMLGLNPQASAKYNYPGQWRMQKFFYVGRFNQWHMVDICIWCALFVTSQFDVIVMFTKQCFGEFC